MTQLSGSSVKTEIKKKFPPKNIRFYTEHTKRWIFFYLDIDTKTITNVSFLQRAIHDQIKNDDQIKSDDRSKFYHLKLWKVEIPAENDMLHLLSNTEIDIASIAKDLGAEFLNPMLDIINYFPVTYDPPSQHVHIIVQPPPPATTDQGRTGVSRDIADLGYVPRREDGLGGTLLLPDQLTSNTNEGISLTDKNTCKRPEIVKSLIDDLLDKKVILVRAPPYSGKTSLTQLIEDYLVNSTEYSTYRVIRFSTLWGNDVGKLCDWKNFGESWKEILGVDWVKWRGECKVIPSILIIDEIQKIYQEPNIDVDKGNKTAAQFWETVKRGLQGSKNIYIIMFGAYGHGSNSAGLSTPLFIPPENSKSLEDIRFTDEELEEYVKVYCSRNFGLSDDDVIILEFISYIQNATAGHVGLVRHVLHYTKGAMEHRICNNKLTWGRIFGYLNSQVFSRTIDACRATFRIDDLSDKQKEICRDIYLKEEIAFSDSNDVKYLIKSGVLVIVNIKDTSYLRYAAPLIMRSFFQQYYGGSETRADSTPRSLYEFIVNVFTIMCQESGELLINSIGYGKDKRLLEQNVAKRIL